MKKLILTVVVAFAGVAANAAYLYWQVAENPGEWTSASVYYSETENGTGSALTSYWAGGSGTSASSGVYQNQMVFADIGNATSGYFWIELNNASSSARWSGQNDSATAYSDLGNSLVATLDFAATAQMAQLTAWTGGTAAAPEPTTGMLTLIGMALLGLRRKRV